MANIHYNRIIRKLVVGFGNMFKDITLVRYNPDFTEAERMLVPLVYGPKEAYVKRLEEDPTLGKKVQITLPRMSFELNGFTYDASRKLNTNTKNFAQTSQGLVSQYNPVPYNFDFSLYAYVRNIEDGTQIMEHILSYFTPDYTIKLNLIPEMGIVKEIPIILNSTTSEVDAEGGFERNTRVVIWTLNFTVKGFIYGKINDSSKGVITHSITSIYNEISADDAIDFYIDENTGLGEYQVGEIVYQGYSRGTAVATGKVIYWHDSVLRLTNINGNFVSNLPIRAASSSTNYIFTDYRPYDQKLVQIDIIPNPADANAASNWTANTIIREFPEVFTPIIPPVIDDEIIDLETGYGVIDLENDLK